MGKDGRKLRPTKAKTTADNAHGVASTHQSPSRRPSAAEDVPAAPRSIADVARLFMGGEEVVEKLVKANSTTALEQRQQQQQAAAKRRRDASIESPKKSSKLDNVKGKTPTKSSLASTAALKGEGKTMKAKKAKEKKTTVKDADPDAEEEDVVLSRAVQAQALSFLQHLAPKHSKAFWGLRDVAQGKGPKAPKPSAPSSSSSSSVAHTAVQRAGKKSKKNARALADDGEELWRVGGPYIPSDDDSEDNKNRSRRHNRDASDIDDDEDAVSRSSATSSEPSWVTDSSDEDEVGLDSDSTSGSTDGEDKDVNGAVGQRNKGGSKAKEPYGSEGGRSGAHKGGGRLFQSGDDIWDNDE